MMMIKYVRFKEIDREKYDQCIRSSIQRRIYAFSWYLDAVAEKWDLLILGDYKAVMPLPTRTKYGIRYVYMPSWTQQLGIYSCTEISKSIQDDFLKKLNKEFLWIDYNMNADNCSSEKAKDQRKNYILSLGRSYEEIQTGFNKNKKRISKIVSDDFSINQDGDLEMFIDVYASHHKSYTVLDDSLNNLRNLYQNKPELVHIWTVEKHSKLIAGLVWLCDKDRITYLVPFANKEAKKNHVPTLLLLQLIKKFQDKDLILDFEGSMIEGVAKFYQSFGAVAESYAHVKKRLMSYG